MDPYTMIHTIEGISLLFVIKLGLRWTAYRLEFHLASPHVLILHELLSMLPFFITGFLEEPAKEDSQSLEIKLNTYDLRHV